MMSFACCESF